MKFQSLHIGQYFRAGIAYQKVSETHGRNKQGDKKLFYPYDRVTPSGSPPLTQVGEIPVGKLFTEISRKEVLRKETETTASRMDNSLVAVYPTDIVIYGEKK